MRNEAGGRRFCDPCSPERKKWVHFPTSTRTRGMSPSLNKCAIFTIQIKNAVLSTVLTVYLPVASSSGSVRELGGGCRRCFSCGAGAHPSMHHEATGP